MVMEVNGNGNAMGYKERSQEMEMELEKLRRHGIGTRNGKIAVKDQNGKTGK